MRTVDRIDRHDARACCVGTLRSRPARSAFFSRSDVLLPCARHETGIQIPLQLRYRISMTFEVLSGHELLRLIVSIVASYLLALPLGWERKRHSQAYIGLRVFPLVAVGACVYVFLGQQLFTG